MGILMLGLLGVERAQLGLSHLWEWEKWGGRG